MMHAIRFIFVLVAGLGLIGLTIAYAIKQHEHEHDHLFHSVEEQALASRQPVVVGSDSDGPVVVLRPWKMPRQITPGGADERED